MQPFLLVWAGRWKSTCMMLHNRISHVWLPLLWPLHEWQVWSQAQPLVACLLCSWFLNQWKCLLHVPRPYHSAVGQWKWASIMYMTSMIMLFMVGGVFNQVCVMSMAKQGWQALCDGHHWQDHIRGYLRAWWYFLSHAHQQAFSQPFVRLVNKASLHELTMLCEQGMESPSSLIASTSRSITRSSKSPINVGEASAATLLAGKACWDFSASSVAVFGSIGLALFNLASCCNGIL